MFGLSVLSGISSVVAVFGSLVLGSFVFGLFVFGDNVAPVPGGTVGPVIGVSLVLGSFELFGSTVVSGGL